MQETTALHPEVNLVIVFRVGSERCDKNEASKAEHQYVRLIDTLTNAGLKAVGKKGKSAGQILVFVTWAQEHFEHLIRRERYVEACSCFFVKHFLSGTCLSGKLIFYPVFLSPLCREIVSLENCRLQTKYVLSMTLYPPALARVAWVCHLGALNGT